MCGSTSTSILGVVRVVARLPLGMLSFYLQEQTR